MADHAADHSHQQPSVPPVDVTRALARWQAELLDLSRRNRLLYLTPGRGVLALSQPAPERLFDGLENQERRYRIYRALDAPPSTDEQLRLVLDADTAASPASPIAVKGVLRPGAAAAGRTELDPAAPPTPSRPPRSDEIVIDGEPKKIDATLYRLRQRARSALVEQGINVLFVAFGTLVWQETDTSAESMLSPLLLVPVTLERPTALDAYTLAPLDDTLVLNPALVRKLAVDFHLPLALPAEDGDLSLTSILDHLRGAVAGRSRWIVRPDVYLGLFSFAKYAMYADLEAQQQRFAAHPLVRAIAGAEDGLPTGVGALPSAEQVDATVHPAAVHQVLDADASQIEAIAAVTAGASLVIQGPPGTGKSQTITNIIAETLARQQTVLFVSEKMAALRVVANRLAATGLAEFCLEAHSQDVNKAAVIKELARTLEAGRRPAGDDTAVEFERLAGVRQHLRAYVVALHDTATPLGRSAFQAHGELAARQQAPIIACDVPDIGALTAARLATWLDTVQDLARVGDVLLGAEAHPWRGCLITASTPQVQAELDGWLRSLAVATGDLAAAQTSLRASWGLPSATSLRAAEWLRDLLALLDERVDVPRHWYEVADLTPLLSLATTQQQRQADARQRRSDLLTRYQTSVFSIDLPATRAALVDGGGAAARRLHGAGAAADRAVAARPAIEHAVATAMTALAALGASADALTDRLGLPPAPNLACCRWLQPLAALVASDPRPLPDWFAPGALPQVEDLVEQAGRRQAVITSGQTALEADFEEEFFAEATAELAARFEHDYAPWFRVFRPGYHRDLGRLRRRRKPPGRLDYAGAVAALTRARRVATARTWLDEHREQLVATLGHHYGGARTDWPAVAAAVATTGAIVRHLAGQEPSSSLRALLAAGAADIRPAVRVFDDALAAAEHALTRLADLASLDGLTAPGVPAAEAPFDELSAGLEGWRDDLTPLWSAVAALTAHRTAGPATVAELARDASNAGAVRDAEAALAAADGALRDAFGQHFAGPETSWPAVLAALAWTDRLRRHGGGGPLGESFVRALEADPPARSPERDQVQRTIPQVASLLDTLAPRFTDQAYRIDGQPMALADLMGVRRWAEQRLAALSRLEEWVDLAHVTNAAERAGLASFVAGVTRERPPPTVWREAFLRQLWTAWLTWRYDQAPVLAHFRGQRHDDLVAEFRALDRQQWPAAARRIAGRLVQQRPVVTPGLPPRSEPALLIKESNKKRRFRPLRKLFADLPHLLPALKPCLLMSPLSVAQFLGESAITFDVVIFDEASQILPADAIGAIGRGRQIVVVGDQKQLPPTRFFSVDARADDDADEDEEVPESVLDACLTAQLPSTRLLWHYRSRHEHLIAFSNRWFYDRRLITFPSPDDHRRAVQFVHVADGVYDRAGSRVNRAEARRIADLVVEHVTVGPGGSLGVIAFSQAQEDAIRLEIDARKRERPELEPLLSEDGLEGFFVKNLENVQGDERDVILFSVGYGPDATGRMTMNFGPINQQGGERRLNVAITRARERVVILASFRPQAIDLARVSAQGVQLLRRYLEYAEQGPVALLGEIDATSVDPESPFEQAVADALVARGMRVAAQIGVGPYRIDLAIQDDAGGHVLGIECDGATYHSARTVRDRDRLRQQVLERLGWHIHRIWSTDWRKDPAREVERVLAALAAVTSGQPSTPLPPPEPPPPALAPDAPPLPADRGTAPVVSSALSLPVTPVAQPYVAASLAPAGDIEAFRSAPVARLADLIHAVVRVEGPVHEDRVMRLVARAYSIGRVGSNVRERLLAAIARAGSDGTVTRRGDFLWLAEMTTPVARAADATGGVRPIREVAPEEVAVAVTTYLAYAFATSRDDLVAGAARALGYDRTGTQVAQAIADIVDGLVESGRLTDVGGQLRLPD